jgi:hypothetical protein
VRAPNESPAGLRLRRIRRQNEARANFPAVRHRGRGVSPSQGRRWTEHQLGANHDGQWRLGEQCTRGRHPRRPKYTESGEGGCGAGGCEHGHDEGDPKQTPVHKSRFPCNTSCPRSAAFGWAVPYWAWSFRDRAPQEAHHIRADAPCRGALCSHARIRAACSSSYGSPRFRRASYTSAVACSTATKQGRAPRNRRPPSGGQIYIM